MKDLCLEFLIVFQFEISCGDITVRSRVTENLGEETDLDIEVPLDLSSCWILIMLRMSCM